MRWLLELLFPPKCMLCRRVLRRGETDLCRKCRANQEPWGNPKRKPQFLDSITAVWYYEGNVRRAILRYKFYGARHLAGGFGRLLAMRLCEKDEAYDILTWVPVSRLRRLTRGYDQVELLAEAVGRELNTEAQPTLRKIRHNRRQSSIASAAQRKANVLGAYRVISPEQIRGKRILLLDDVLTTGATAGECARMLLTAGAKEVHCAVIATARKE
ncbi:MAG: ComF family protein [Faecousia sp.]